MRYASESVAVHLATLYFATSFPLSLFFGRGRVDLGDADHAVKHKRVRLRGDGLKW